MRKKSEQTRRERLKKQEEYNDDHRQEIVTDMQKVRDNPRYRRPGGVSGDRRKIKYRRKAFEKLVATELARAARKLFAGRILKDKGLGTFTDATFGVAYELLLKGRGITGGVSMLELEKAAKELERELEQDKRKLSRETAGKGRMFWDEISIYPSRGGIALGTAAHVDLIGMASEESDLDELDAIFDNLKTFD